MELFAAQQTPSQTKLIMSGEVPENSIKEFHLDTDVNSTFSTWFTRFEDIFNVDFREQTDDREVRILLRKIARFNCLNITKFDTVDFMTFAGTVNKE